MTRLTTDPTLEYLTEFIEEYAGFGDGGEHADWLAEETDYVDRRDTHTSCRECGGDVKRLSLDGQVEVVCHNRPNDHTYRLNPRDAFAHQLDPVAILRDVGRELGYEPNEQNSSCRNPTYAALQLAERARVALILRPSRHEYAMDDLFADAVKNGRVNAVFTPTDFEGLDWGAVLRKPIAAAAPPFPLELLGDTVDEVRRQLDSASTALDRRELVLSSGSSDTDLLRHLNQNPRATQFELEYAPIFRLAGSPDSRRISTRFEEVCSTGFEMLDFPDKTEELGTNNRGDIVADIAFTIQSDSSLPDNRGGGNILGIVDAKSNAEANLGKERIVKKHAEYLQQANVPPFRDSYHIAHVFVVLSMQGHKANEIDWYDAIEADYHGRNVEDITMVVLYADALAHMLDIQLTAKQRNEANLSVGDVKEIFRPFFNYRGFKRDVAPEIRATTRVDGRDISSSGESYREEYKQRERLLVVTREMVDKHYRNKVEKHNQVGRILSGYGDSL